MTYLFIGMMIGVIIGTTIGSLAVAFKSAEKEIARLDKEVKDAHKVKAKVDFKFCMGNIPAMLRATKPVLSEKQYKELCNEVNKADGYLEQKRIIFSYVDPIIKG